MIISDPRRWPSTATVAVARLVARSTPRRAQLPQLGCSCSLKWHSPRPQRPPARHAGRRRWLLSARAAGARAPLAERAACAHTCSTLKSAGRDGAARPDPRRTPQTAGYVNPAVDQTGRSSPSDAVSQLVLRRLGALQRPVDRRPRDIVGGRELVDRMRAGVVHRAHRGVRVGVEGCRAPAARAAPAALRARIR